MPQASPAALEAAGGLPLRPGELLDLDEDFLLSFVLRVVSIPLRFSGLVPRGVAVGEIFGTGNIGGEEIAFEISLAGEPFFSLDFWTTESELFFEAAVGLGGNGSGRDRSI